MYQQDLELAVLCSQDAGQIALRYWNSGVVAETKPDTSPVTIADREAERAIVARLASERPDDGILGEEGAARPSRSGRRWIVDPIDGTRDFVRGSRTWAVLIGLEDQGEVVAGVVLLPALGDTYWAVKNEGAFCNGECIHVSGIQHPSQAVLCVNGLNRAGREPWGAHLPEFAAGFWSVRSFGGCLDAAMVSRGQADLWIEPVAAAWDLAPLKILTEEAGGRFFNFDGGASIHGGNCITCTPALENVARAFLGL